MVKGILQPPVNLQRVIGNFVFLPDVLAGGFCQSKWSHKIDAVFRNIEIGNPVKALSVVYKCGLSVPFFQILFQRGITSAEAEEKGYQLIVRRNSSKEIQITVVFPEFDRETAVDHTLE